MMVYDIVCHALKIGRSTIFVAEVAKVFDKHVQATPPSPLKPCYAIIPAAGISRRMGQPKLLLPWPARQPPSHTPLQASDPSTSNNPSSGMLTMATVMDRVLDAWTSSQVTETVVVIRSDDTALQDICRRWPVTIVHARETTEDMKGTVCIGLQSLISRRGPVPDARCFIAPADLPGLTSHVIDRLIATQSSPPKIFIPRFGSTLEKSIAGHPALVPWKWTREIFTLGPDQGVNAFIQRHPREFVLFPAEMVADDFDTPEEYWGAFKSAK